eukprot:1156978-Pelagomonas_calceolata.AAC.13
MRGCGVAYRFSSPVKALMLVSYHCSGIPYIHIQPEHAPTDACPLCVHSQIVSALQFMHSQDIVHGDLSAWNVMLTSLVKGNDSRGWVSKVADFGGLSGVCSGRVLDQ